MILMRENPIPGPLEGVSLENWDFFGPKKVEIFRAREIDFPASKSLSQSSI